MNLNIVGCRSTFELTLGLRKIQNVLDAVELLHHCYYHWLAVQLYLFKICKQLFLKNKHYELTSYGQR